MASGSFSENIHDHGTSVPDTKNKVRCGHCEKVVSGFYRLKCHLGGIRGDVTPCVQVPTNVKNFFRDKIIEQKAERFPEEIGKPKLIRLGGPKSEADICTGSASVSSAEVIKLSVARFFYESDIDFNCINMASFHRLVSTSLGVQMSDSQLFPTSHEFEGKLLEDTLKIVQEKVYTIKNSWKKSGCSILLDAWHNYEGQHLVNFLVDCPEGPIYLQSAEFSNIKESNSLQVLVDNIIQEVGLENVVQIMTSCGSWTSPILEQIVDHHKLMFHTVSASDCIDYILQQIMETMPDIKEVTSMASNLFTFLYRNTMFSENFGGSFHDESLVKLWKFTAAEPFLMLENILLKKSSLQCMLRSSEWNISSVAKTVEGEQVSKLIQDPSFWIQAKWVNKATSALLRALTLIVNHKKPFIGFIYEIMDQIKESIKDELEEESGFVPFWELIDDIWNNVLHCPLHAAAYYLNPCFFYSKDFNLDDEVGNGLMSCIIGMVQHQRTKNLVLEQLQTYTNGHGPFKRGMAEDIINNVDPVSWWVKYGSHCPELQRFSIRILSQTCDGPTKYGLRKSMAEKLSTDGMSTVEQKHLQDLMYMHYNLNLQSFKQRHSP